LKSLPGQLNEETVTQAGLEHNSEIDIAINLMANLTLILSAGINVDKDTVVGFAAY
jgi:hypothetical protein